MFTGLCSAEPLTTSISDSDDLGYLASVRRAVSDEAFLLNFRSDPDYKVVLEHVSYSLGQMYLDEIVSKYNANPSSVFAGLSKLSEFGNPVVHNFAGAGAVSPTILRYVKVAYEMEALFGDLSRMKIGEIGVGFGGQAAVLNGLFGVSEYVAFDLPEVLRLFELFNRRTDSHIVAKLVDGRKPESEEVDILVSNYAFSELSMSIQDEYLNKVVLRARSGYMIWNNLSSKHLDGYSLRDIIRKIPGAIVLKETPRSAKSNRMIVWGYN
jgi:hypothetical protein